MPARALPPPNDDALAELADLVVGMHPADLERFASTLPSPDRQLLERVMAGRHAVGWRADPASMAAHLDPTFHPYRYVRLLSSRFVDATEGRRRRQVWAMPGRIGKTTMLQWGLTWALDLTPSGRSIYVSYGDDLALETGATVRDLLERHAGELRVQLRRDRRARDRWLTPEGGGLLAAGIRSRDLAASAGIYLPLYPIKGYSLTAPIRTGDIAPEVSVTDFERKVLYARIGSKLRVAAMADIVGENTRLDPRRIAGLTAQVRAMMPGAADYGKLTAWAGLRPATPGSAPIIGPTPCKNLWLNVGHGGLGFTFACGSARILADLMLGKQAPIAMDGMTLG